MYQYKYKGGVVGPTGQTDGLICQALIEREACIDEQWRVSFAVIWIRKFEYNVR